MYSSHLNEIPAEKRGLAVRSVLLMIDFFPGRSQNLDRTRSGQSSLSLTFFFSFSVLQNEVDSIRSDSDSVDATFYARHLPDICVPAI